MRNRNITKRLLAIASWIFIWGFVWIALKDYPPTHAHFDYFGLASPALFLMLPFYGSSLTSDAVTLIVIPGVIFWLVLSVVFFMTRTKAKAADISDD